MTVRREVTGQWGQKARECEAWQVQFQGAKSALPGENKVTRLSRGWENKATTPSDQGSLPDLFERGPEPSLTHVPIHSFIHSFIHHPVSLSIRSNMPWPSHHLKPAFLTTSSSLALDCVHLTCRSLCPAFSPVPVITLTSRHAVPITQSLRLIIISC